MASKEHATFHQQVSWYHGNALAPNQLRNHRLEPSVNITEGPKGWTWEDWDHYNKIATTHKGFFVTNKKPYAAYFATRYHKKDVGYVYAFPKPKDMKHAMGIEDFEDKHFVTKPIVPTHVYQVTKTKKLGLSPHEARASDFKFKEARFKDALKSSHPFYYREQNHKRIKVRKHVKAK